MGNLTDVLVVGSGVFGIAAALELRARGHRVALLDSSPIPHPLAASTDIAKVVRVEYGGDEEYTTLAERAREGWLRWNAEMFDEPLYHEVGLLKLTRGPMATGSYEYENYRSLLARGYRLERLTQQDIKRRFPAWNSELYVDGYLNPKGGYVESGRVVEQLFRSASAAGIVVHIGQTAVSVETEGNRVVRVRTREGESFQPGEVLVTCGAWTPLLLPELAALLRPVGQPIFHVVPDDPSLFEPPHFYVFSADSARTGWYGFPFHPRAGVVKIAHHGRGWPVDPVRDTRTVPATYVERFRAFLAETFPALAGAKIVYTRCCLYCDTPDEHFWIARHPELSGLTVAAGDSGHGFKFAPILGDLIADALERLPNRHLHRFRWRELTRQAAGAEASRHREAF